MNLAPQKVSSRLGNRATSMLGPLVYPALIIGAGLLVLTLSRLALTIVYRDRFAETPNFLLLFPIGLRMDLILLSYLTIIPTVLLLLLSSRLVLRLRKLFAGWAAAALGLIVYMEIATVPFMEEYDLRPDSKFFEYLKHPREVFGTLFKSYALELVIGAIALLVFVAVIWRLALFVLENHRPWRWQRRICCFPFVSALLVLGARSSLDHRPANLSAAAFSTNHLANELALNSTYSLFYAAYRVLKHEKNPSKMYGTMESAEVFERVRATLVGEELRNSATEPIPFLHKQRSPFELKRPPNVVIFLQESMGASDVGCLNGAPTTPNLCALKDQGLWLSNLHATGTRTARGIEATLSGFLPTANKGAIKLEHAKRDFFTAASLFKRHGYATEFHYGGISTFDEMRAFCLGNGFDKIYDQENFTAPVFTGTWGVSDEDLVQRANEIFRAHGDKPFFALMLSTSNHPPFEFPDGRIELYEQPKQTHFNAIKYADFAIGRLIELARSERYFENTIFVIVADHNANVRGNDLVPIDKFHIPALLLGPNVPRQEISTLSSQIDLLPTILHFTGLETEHPMVGRNLMTLPPESSGRAFMQFAENNAYRVDDQVIIHQPFMEPRQFTVGGAKGDKLLPAAELDPELARDALAYAYLPWLQYSRKVYRLPEE